jgi:hypothetical protein
MDMDNGRSVLFVAIVKVLASKRGGMLTRAVSYVLSRGADDTQL